MIILKMVFFVFFFEKNFAITHWVGKYNVGGGDEFGNIKFMIECYFLLII